MIKYRILHEHNLIAICNWGKTSLEEIVQLRKDLQSDPSFSPSYDAIVDSSQSESAYTRDEIEKVVFTRMIDPRHSVGKVAIIASSDLLFGISRMHETVSEIYEKHRDSSVFRNSASALQWLGREGLDIGSIFEEIKREEPSEDASHDTSL